MSTSLTDTVWRLAEPWLAAERVELDDVVLVGQGKGRTLRLLVDHPDGVDLDHLAALSDGLSRLLDDEPGLSDPYRLEVSSPGLERVLRRARHWEKAVGRDVTVKVQRGDGRERIAGRLVSFDGESAVVEVDEGPERGSEVQIDLDEVATAKTVFRWEKQPPPGSKSGSKSR